MSKFEQPHAAALVQDTATSLSCPARSLPILEERDCIPMRVPEMGIRILPEVMKVVEGRRSFDLPVAQERWRSAGAANATFQSFPSYFQSYLAGRYVTGLRISAALMLNIAKSDYLVGMLEKRPEGAGDSFGLVSCALEPTATQAGQPVLASACCNQLLSKVNDFLLPHIEGEILKKVLCFNPVAYMGERSKSLAKEIAVRRIALPDPFEDVLDVARSIAPTTLTPATLPECIKSVVRSRALVMPRSFIASDCVRGYVDTSVNSIELVAGIRLTLPDNPVSLGCSRQCEVSDGRKLRTVFVPLGLCLVELNKNGGLTGNAFRLEKGDLKPIQGAAEIRLSGAFTPQIQYENRATGMVDASRLTLGNGSNVDCVS